VKITSEWLADLIRHVPIHVIDVPAARQAGDTAAVAYASEMAEWRAEAAQAVAAALATSPAHSSDALPDAYARSATVSALTRSL